MARLPDRLPPKVREEVTDVASRVRPAELVQVDHQGLVALDQQLVAPEGAVAQDRRWLLVRRRVERPDCLAEGEGQRGCRLGDGRGVSGEIRVIVSEASRRPGRDRGGVLVAGYGSSA